MQSFNTRNNASFSYNIKGVSIGLNALFCANIQNLKSELFTLPLGNNSIKAISDDMSNNIYWQDISASISPQIGYMIHGVFSIHGLVNMSYHNILRKDRIVSERELNNKVLFNPMLTITTYITQDFKLQISAFYDESYGSIYDNYNGYIMSNYRYISKNTGELKLSKYNSSSAKFSYSDSFSAFFMDFGANYYRVWNNLQRSTKFSDNILTYTESIYSPNISDGVNAHIGLSKRIYAINTTYRLNLRYNRSWNELLLDDKTYNMVYDNVLGKFMFDTKFCNWANMDYSINAMMSLSNSDLTEYQDPIYSFNQKLGLKFIIDKNLFIGASAEHYYNDAIPNQKSTFYLDAYCRYKYKQFEFELELRNLLNTKTYNSVVYSNVMTYSYSYDLNPIGAIFKVRYDF